MTIYYAEIDYGFGEIVSRHYHGDVQTVSALAQLLAEKHEDERVRLYELVESEGNFVEHRLVGEFLSDMTLHGELYDAWREMPDGERPSDFDSYLSRCESSEYAKHIKSLLIQAGLDSDYQRWVMS